jgi:deferrochelatase/peroxidase EfeB
MRSLQEGIYYKKGLRPGQSLGIIFLRVNKTSKASDVGQLLTRIWNTCKNLKRGILGDYNELKIAYPKLYQDLTILIGFGSGIFGLEGTFRKRPSMFSDDIHFEEPTSTGGSLFVGSDLIYQESMVENPIAFDDIVLQFISGSPFITNQCIVEIWHELYRAQREDKNGHALSITRFYDGFRRSDNRNWIGFHDGVSNIKEQERKGVIAINQSQVKLEDSWTIEGTFMGFIRMYIELPNWWNVGRIDQELMVGRDKATGCPLMGINEITGKNIVVKGCPIPGTKEVTDKGNEIYRNHPRYGFQNLPPGVSDERLKFSHIGETRRIQKRSIWQKEQYRVFRQGYEFLEKIELYPGLRAGLNFISFQDNPISLFNILTNLNNDKTSNIKTGWNRKKNENVKRLKFNTFFKVGAAGIFFVPPFNLEERFPGASIFFSSNRTNADSTF